MRGTLAVIVVYSRRVGLWWLHREQPQEPSFKIKRSFRGSVSHAIPLCGKQSFFFLKGCRGVFIQTSGFIDTFGRRKTAPKQPKIPEKLFKKRRYPYCGQFILLHTPTSPPADTPKENRLCRVSSMTPIHHVVSVGGRIARSAFLHGFW